MNIVQGIHDANPGRQISNIFRRLVKAQEELGEASEAFLNTTTPTNPKAKSWRDVCEELADVVIVLIDVGLTPIGDRSVDFDYFTSLIDRGLRTLNPDHFEQGLLIVGRNVGEAANELVGVISDGIEDDFVAFKHFIGDAVLYTTICFQQACDCDRIDDSREFLGTEIERKLAKWRNNRDTAKVVTDDV